MTEAQWLVCPVPGPMLALLRRQGRERPLLLFVLACLGHHPRLLEARPPNALDLIRQRADGGEVSPQEWSRACAAPWDAGQAADAIGEQAVRAAARVALAAGDDAGRAGAAELGRQADLLRCIVGNPFRPVRAEPAWLAWQGASVERLARAIDAEEALDRLPVLADALEEAGCTDPQLLRHCRGSAHAPGCWVLDALLRTGPAPEPGIVPPDGDPSCLFCGEALEAGVHWDPEGMRCPACAMAEKYQLLRPISAGGRQETQVWLARAAGGAEVAIKFLRVRPQDAAARSDPAEVRHLTELQHPFLLQTLACLPLAGYLVVVMELARGSLRDRLRECRRAGQPGIPAAELLGHLRDAGEALDYLHDHRVRVRHGGVRPGNLLLGGDGRIRVADAAQDRILSAAFEGAIVGAGVPAYLAPEVWRGQPGRASDRFALAVTYVELRLGRRPFGGQTLVDVMRGVFEGEPDLDGLPAPEQAVVRRALDPIPARRYPTCRAFVNALAAALGLPAPPPPPGSGVKGVLDRLTCRWRNRREGR